MPVTLFNNNDTSLLGTIPNGINNNGVDTPDYTPGNLAVNTDPRNGKPAFNTSLFRLPDWDTPARRRGGFSTDREWRISMWRCTRAWPDRIASLELRFEAFNVLNRGQFYGPASVNGNISSASFGQVVSAGAPRLIQLAAKFHF